MRSGSLVLSVAGSGCLSAAGAITFPRRGVGERRLIEEGQFKVAGTDKAIALPMVALAAYTARNLSDGMEPA